MRRRHGGDIEALYRVIKLLVDAKRHGTWGLLHSFVIVGFVICAVGFAGFIGCILTQTIKAIPYFFGVFACGVLLVAALSFVIRLRSESKKTDLTGAEEAGKEGEQHTAHQLDYLGREYKVFNNVYIQHNGKRQEFDHIVIGINGVFHIESKAYSGNLLFSATGLSKNGQPVEDPTGQVYRHQFILEAIIKDAGISCDVTGIICFAHPNCTLNGSSPKFITCKVDRLIHSIVSYQPETHLDSAALKRTADAIREHIKHHNTNYKRA